MTRLTENGRKALIDVAGRHDVSGAVVEHLLVALIAGRGTQARFDHAELGGAGQWSQGSITGVSDRFDTALKAKIDALCSDLARLMRGSEPLYTLTPSATHAPYRQSLSRISGVPDYRTAKTHRPENRGSPSFEAGTVSNWWPKFLGKPAFTGAQGPMRYASFPEAARLVIDAGDGRLRTFDTGDHRIGGLAQYQTAGQPPSFSSEHGLVKLSELREVEEAPPDDSVAGAGAVSEKNVAALSDALLRATTDTLRPAASAGPADLALPGPESRNHEPPASETSPAATAAEEADIFAKIESLAALHGKGILSDQEYQSKKAELLARI